MTRRWPIRALLALAVPALLVTTVATPADAATKAPRVPKVTEVAEIYPHLVGGDASVSGGRTHAVGTSCDEEGAVIKGGISREVTYLPAYDAEEPGQISFTGDAPILGLLADRLPSVTIAKRYVRGQQAAVKKCAKSEGRPGKLTIKRIAVRIGQQSWGYQLTWKTTRSKQILTGLVVRRGTDVVSVFAMALVGGKAPSTPKVVKLAKLALERL